VSKLKAIIDSGIRSGIDKSQPPRQMPDEAARQAIRPTEKTIDDFSNEDSFYRIVDEDAYIDLVNSGAVRTNFGNKPGSTIEDKLASRPTRYPSFSKGSANKTYAEGKPNHYIIETKDPSIKPSTEGRHGKGTTQFPTGSTGVHLESLPGEAVQVYRHIGDGQYRLVYDQGKVTPNATNAETNVAAPLGIISIPIAAAIAAGTMTPQEAQAGPVSKALAELAKRADAGDEAARQGIRGYHGSPYNFPPVRELEMPDGAVVYQSMDDAVPEGARVIKEHPLGRFDMSKIGTGEGAQAYGRGLYFAQAEDVGKGYRDQLSEGLGTVDGESIGGWAAEILDNSKGDPSALRARINMAPDDFWVMNFEEGIAAKDNLLGVVDRLESGVSTWRPGGHMYEVDIDANPDELLDWDKPLSEQSDFVREKLQALGVKDNKKAVGEYDDALFDALFNDSNRALPKTPVDLSGKHLYYRSAPDATDPADASKALKDIGIKGIRYKDGFSRGADNGTSNYVIFDDRLISIAKKYGVSIPIAAKIAEGIITPEEAQAVGFGPVVKKSLSGKTDEIQQGIGSLPAGDEMVTGGDLQFLMNIRPGSLRAQQDMGAFPMPSLAVVRQDQPFDSFGEITLVGNPASFDPKRLKANVVFNADAYTVRAPRPFRIAQKDAGLQFKNRFEPVAKEFQEGRVSDLTYELGNMELKKRATAQGFADIQRFFESDLIADVVFLREKGITDIPTTEGAGGNIFLERASLQDLIEPYADERRAWGRKELNKLFKEEEFFDASTNRDYYTGKGLKLKPYTAEEVLKFMKKNRGSAQEGGMSTPGALRASLTEKLSSLKDIRAQSGKLVKSDDFKDFQNSSYERISDLGESLKPFYKFDSSGFGYSNEVIEMLIESQKRGLDRALSEFGFDNLPDYALQEIQEVKSFFRNAPTEYFEAKPERLVDIEEFEGAIVPEGTSDDIIQALKDSGIKIETYADDVQRLNARKKFLGTAFSVAGGITLVALVAPEESYAAGPSNFTKMNKLVREQSVKQAKEQGYDLDNVMYHASKQDIEEFVPGYSDGLVFLTPNKEFANDWLGKGKFQERQGGTGSIEGVRAEKKRFMEEQNEIMKSMPEDQRQQYFEEILNPQQQQLIKDELLADSAIYPVVTRTKKPFVPSKDVDVLEELYGKEYLDAPFGSGFPTYRDALKDGNYGLYEKKEVVDFLKSKGYDSMFLKESGGADKPFTTLAVFDPNNIRSVNAEFDPKKKDSPQILASNPFATGITGLLAAAVLSSEEAQAGPLSAAGRAAQMGLPVRPAREDLNTVLQANMIGGRVVGDETVPIDSLMGGAASSKRGQDAVNRITEQMSGPDGYIERLIVDQDGNVIEGAHRLDALRRLGIRDVPVTRISDPTAGIDVAAMSQAINDVGVTHPDHVNQIVASVGEMLAEVGGDPAKVLDQYVFPRGYEDKFRAALGALGVAGAAGSAQASEYPSLGGMGVTSRAMPDEVAFKAPMEPRRIPEKQPPGIASLAGQLGLGAMSEIGGAIFGGLSGLGEYVRGGGLLGVPVGEPSTAESIRNINEGVSGYVGDLYDAGPEAQALGQQIMQGIGETIAPIAEYAMEGDITDEYGINMLPLLTQKLGIPLYEQLERLYYMLPEREQEALKSGADFYL
jgi:hypothetical protein